MALNEWYLKNEKLLLILALFLVAMILIVGVFSINQKGKECLMNPMVYGADVLRDYHDSEIYCECRAYGDQPHSYTFRDSISAEEKLFQNLHNTYSFNFNVTGWTQDIEG